MARKTGTLTLANDTVVLAQDVRSRFANFSFAGTHASAVVRFEGSNGTDATGTKRWFTVEALQQIDNNPVTGNIGLGSNASVGYVVFAPGCVEVRAILVSIGSGAVQVVASADDLSPIPLSIPPAAAAAGVELAAASGAIASRAGVVIVTAGSAATLTLAAPSAGADDGKRLLIVTATAAAHTVTVTAGFNGGGSGTDVATFTAAIGNGLEVVAYNGVWYVVSLRNVTLG